MAIVIGAVLIVCPYLALYSYSHFNNIAILIILVTRIEPNIAYFPPRYNNTPFINLLI